ncbi:hypothetical protein HDU96_009972 [Phlyctochytrium bullatum]|nr:hypothetical protein HDU96_009972 [Phlyctochytrium bullatum]
MGSVNDPTALQRTTVALYLNIPSSEASAGGFATGAIQGCREFVLSRPEYVCKEFFVPTRIDSEEIAGRLRGDGTVVHVVFVGFVFREAMRVVAKGMPEVRFSLIDDSIDATFTSNCQGITFAEDEAGFLAGIVAGALSNSSSVGVMGNLPIPPVTRYVQGFLNGVRYVNPAATVYGMYNLDYTWSNTTLAMINAKAFLDKNIDAAGGLGSATLKAIAAAGKWVIGVDSDESLTTFSNKSDPSSTHLFASALKRIDRATVILLNESLSGSFYSGNKVLDSAVGGVGLTGCSSARACAELAKPVIYQDVDYQNAACATVRRSELGSLISVMTSRVQEGGLSLASKGLINGLKLKTNGTWSEIPTFGDSPLGLQAHTMDFLGNNSFLVFGGKMPTGNASSRLWRYDYDFLTWTLVDVKNGPALYYHGTVYRPTTRELIVTGGTDASGNVNGNVWRFSVATQRWSVVQTKGESPGKRMRHSVVLVGDSDMYFWGGQDDGFNVQNDFWRLDLMTFTWTRIASPGVAGTDYPDARHSAALVSPTNSTLLLFGGSDGSSESSRLWEYSTREARWTLLSPKGDRLPSVSRPGATMLDQRRVLFLGGTTGKLAQTGAFVYNVALNVWTAMPRMNLPAAVQGFSAVAFVQTDYAGACGYGQNTTFTVCEPLNDTAVLRFGGSHPSQGIIGSLQLAFVEPEEPPQPIKYPAQVVLYAGMGMAGFGVLFCLACLAVVFHFRNEPRFRSASPRFLTVYVVGRIYYIFLKKKSVIKSNYLQDWVLLSFVGLLVLINGAFVGIFTRFSTYQASTLPHPPTNRTQTVIINVDGDNYAVCRTQRLDPWLVVTAAPICIVLMVGLYIGVQTRNVVSTYNETSHINLSVYAVVTALMLIVPVAIFLKDPTTQYLINSLLLCLAIFTVLITHIVTKVMAIWSHDTFTDSIAGTVDPTLPEAALHSCKFCKQPLRAGGTASRAPTLLHGKHSGISAHALRPAVHRSFAGGIASDSRERLVVPGLGAGGLGGSRTSVGSRTIARRMESVDADDEAWGAGLPAVTEIPVPARSPERVRWTMRTGSLRRPSGGSGWGGGRKVAPAPAGTGK